MTMVQRRAKSVVQSVPPVLRAVYGTPREDFRVPGPHGLVVFQAGKRVLVEPSVRRLLSDAAPIVWEDE